MFAAEFIFALVDPWLGIARVRTSQRVFAGAHLLNASIRMCVQPTSDFWFGVHRVHGVVDGTALARLTVLAPSAVQLQRASRRGLLMTPAMRGG